MARSTGATADEVWYIFESVAAKGLKARAERTVRPTQTSLPVVSMQAAGLEPSERPSIERSIRCVHATSAMSGSWSWFCLTVRSEDGIAGVTVTLVAPTDCAGRPSSVHSSTRGAAAIGTSEARFPFASTNGRVVNRHDARRLLGRLGVLKHSDDVDLWVLCPAHLRTSDRRRPLRYQKSNHG